MDKKNQYQPTPFGLFYGPYGHVGYVGTIQREDLKEIAKIFFGLFRWAKRAVAALF